jgi:hypothetical protein
MEQAMIGPEREAAILRLYHAEKWPVGTIACQLGMHHSTVKRVLAQAGLEARLRSPRPSIVDPPSPFSARDAAAMTTTAAQATAATRRRP